MRILKTLFIVNRKLVMILSTIDNIVALLEEQKKTQKELCDYLGITKNAFTDWKSGRIKSYTKYLPQIADYFGVSVDFLLGKETDKPAGVPDAMWAELCKDEKRKALAMWIMSLPDDELDRAEKLLDAGKLFPPDHS